MTTASLAIGAKPGFKGDTLVQLSQLTRSLEKAVAPFVEVVGAATLRMAPAIRAVAQINRQASAASARLSNGFPDDFWMNELGPDDRIPGSARAWKRLQHVTRQDPAVRRYAFLRRLQRAAIEKADAESQPTDWSTRRAIRAEQALRNHERVVALAEHDKRRHAIVTPGRLVGCLPAAALFQLSPGAPSGAVSVAALV